MSLIAQDVFRVHIYLSNHTTKLLSNMLQVSYEWKWWQFIRRWFLLRTEHLSVCPQQEDRRSESPSENLINPPNIHYLLVWSNSHDLFSRLQNLVQSCVGMLFIFLLMVLSEHCFCGKKISPSTVSDKVSCACTKIARCVLVRMSVNYQWKKQERL